MVHELMTVVFLHAAMFRCVHILCSFVARMLSLQRSRDRIYAGSVYTKRAPPQTELLVADVSFLILLFSRCLLTSVDREIMKNGARDGSIPSAGGDRDL